MPPRSLAAALLLAALAPAQEEPAASDVSSSLRRAERLVASGDPAAAVDLLSDLLDRAPDDGRVVFAFGRALFAQGSRAAAEGDRETAGYALLDARRYLAEAADLLPDDPTPLVWAARVERALGDPEAARRLLERALERDPRCADALVELAGLRYPEIGRARRAGDEKAAAQAADAVEALYRRALESDPANAYAWNGLGWVAWARGDTEGAIDAFARSLELDPTLADSSTRLLELTGEDRALRREAVKRLDRVVAKAAGTPAEATARFQRAQARLRLRDVEGAREDFERARELDPSLAPLAAGMLARGLFSAGLQDEAADTLLDAIAADFDALLDAVARAGRGRDLALACRALADRRFREGDLESARELTRLAAYLLGDDPVTWNNYAFFCRETGRFEESLAAYERALELDPANPSLLNDTALILHYHLRRDLDRAEELYRRAIEEGERVLADPASDDFAREAARTAVRDATNNLRRLERLRAKGGDAQPDNGGG